MKNLHRMVWSAAILLLLSGCSYWAPHSEHRNPPTEPAAAAVTTVETQSSRQDVLYVCDCGEACQCNSMSTAPGNCACGKPMRWHHVLKIEGDEALLCTCQQGCQCRIDPNDPGKCGCGQAVKRVSLKGTGIHFCNCGGSCFCNTVSDQAGECRCGMPLKTL